MNAIRTAFLVTTLAATTSVFAQAPVSKQPDVAISYIAEHGNPVAAGGNFWLQGGSAELGATPWHGFGFALNVTGTHTQGFGPSNIPLNLVSTMIGPRYRFTVPSKFSHGKDVSVFAEGLVGESHGFGSYFPQTGGADTSALSFASQVGGGIDFSLGRHIAVRAIQANWARLQLPNATTNVQNNLRLGAGVVFKF